jgi:protein SCO1/2
MMQRFARLLLLALSVGASVSPALAEETQKPNILRDVDFEQRLDTQLPLDLMFRDESGRAVPLREYFGDKPVILSLAYYECPMLCTLVLNGLTSALRALRFDIGKEFQVVTVSFDPSEGAELAAAKKAAHLKEYRRPGSEAGWHFLTGDEGSIRALTEAVGFKYAYDPATKQYAHAAGIIVATPQGRLSRYFYGVEFAPRDLRLGLIEAANGKIGNLADQFLLYCFHYDPSTGKYSAVTLNAIRLGGLLTVALLGSFIFVMLRRERQGVRTPGALPLSGGVAPRAYVER